MNLFIDNEIIKCELLENNIYFFSITSGNFSVESYKNNKHCISFINMPDNSAIRAFDYFKSRPGKKKRIRDTINTTSLLANKIGSYSFSELLLLIIYSEIQKDEIIMVGTAGLDESSVEIVKT